MGNKIIYMVLAGVFSFGWFYTGFSDHYAAEDGAIGSGYLFISFVALALGAGKSDDAGNPIETIINGLKSFVPAFIALLVMSIVSRVIYEAGLNPEGFQVSGLIDSLSTTAAASVLIVLVMSCLNKAK